jgi:hypothetical protein
MDAERLALAQRLPGASQQLILHEPSVYPYGALFSLPANYVAPAHDEPAAARLGDRVDVLPVILPTTPLTAGATLPLTLRWRVSGPLAGRYNYFVHLASPAQALITGTDAEPCGGWYPTSVWHANEVIEQNVQLPLPGNLAPGQYAIMVGLYDWQTGARLAVTQPNQREPDRAYVGAIEVK